MKILAIETATEACSAALYLEGEVLERYALAPQQHNHLILPMVESLFEESGLALAQMDGLAFGRGPGSFTGVRIATGIVQGLAFAADLPVAPVSTLAALALQALDETEASYVFACMDARMSEVYWGVYGRTEVGAALLGQETVGAAEAVEVGGATCGVGIGSGWTAYGEILCKRTESVALSGVIEGRFPRASHVARIGARVCQSGGGVAAELAQPVYLRDQVAKKPGLRP